MNGLFVHHEIFHAIMTTLKQVFRLEKQIQVGEGVVKSQKLLFCLRFVPLILITCNQV